MASVNKIFIMGRLGQDPELRYTANQTAVVTMNVATTETWTRDGQKNEQTEWHRIIVWNKPAENCAKYLSKGSSVFVEGKLQTRSWDDKNGQKRYTTEIVANSVQFLSSANQGQGHSQQTQATQNNYSSEQHSFPPAQKESNPHQTDESHLDNIPF